MIVEYIRYSVTSDRAAQLEAAYATARPVLERSPHCLAFELSRCAEEPTSYILRIEWDSIEGHLGGFRKGSDFQEFFAAIRPFVDDIQEMRHYEQTAITSKEQP